MPRSVLLAERPYFLPYSRHCHHLYINDYNLDSNNAKVAGIVNLVRAVNNQGTKLIDGIGTQTHLNAGGASVVQVGFTALAGSGVDVAITELDIAGASTHD